MATLFSVECKPYFDWQSIGLVHSYRKAKQPGPITRLLSCTPEQLETYQNLNITPTMIVPSYTHHPVSGDWYPAINKPVGVLHWVLHSPQAQEVDWVVILDADQIMRGPIDPWELKAKKGQPVAAYYGYLIGCDNILAQLHTKHPHLCDKVGGFIVMHIEDLRKFAPLWLSKTEEVRADKAHYWTNITGDIYGQGWISEMYGYSFGAAELELRHQINNWLMLYPGYEPAPDQDVRLLHYGLPFGVDSWRFGKSEHHNDAIVNDCNRLFPTPPFPEDVADTEPTKRLAALYSIETVNTINEGLVIHHATHGCPEPEPSRYLSFLKANIVKGLGNGALEGQYPPNPVAELTTSARGRLLVWWWWVLRGRQPPPPSREEEEAEADVAEGGVEVEEQAAEVDAAVPPPLHKPGPPSVADLWNPLQAPGRPKMATIFSVECNTYFDWQALGLFYSFARSGQPGPITRLLSCTDEDLESYRGMDMGPTLAVPSWSRHPITGEWYPAINKPVGVNHWLKHSEQANEVEWVLILDADMILRSPILPWELDAEKGRPVSAPYDYLIGCDNILGQLHMKNPLLCDKVGGYIVMHIDDLRTFAPLWLSKTEEVRADKAHYATNITGDIYGEGWISEMYGYSFAASDLELRHTRNNDIMLYPGYQPLKDVEPALLHYGLEFMAGDWEFDKSKWHNQDMAFDCTLLFPEPADPATITNEDELERRKMLINIETVQTLNYALKDYHAKKGCRPGDEKVMDKPDQAAADEGWDAAQEAGEQEGEGGEEGAGAEREEATMVHDEAGDKVEEGGGKDMGGEEDGGGEATSKTEEGGGGGGGQFVAAEDRTNLDVGGDSGDDGGNGAEAEQRQDDEAGGAESRKLIDVSGDGHLGDELRGMLQKPPVYSVLGLAIPEDSWLMEVLAEHPRWWMVGPWVIIVATFVILMLRSLCKKGGKSKSRKGSVRRSAAARGQATAAVPKLAAGNGVPQWAVSDKHPGKDWTA
eukprot:SM000077S21530  [mRNA]  locus=s77:14012:19510:+ [translate_table: standard]